MSELIDMDNVFGVNLKVFILHHFAIFVAREYKLYMTNSIISNSHPFNELIDFVHTTFFGTKKKVWSTESRAKPIEKPTTSLNMQRKKKTKNQKRMKKKKLDSKPFGI